MDNKNAQTIIADFFTSLIEMASFFVGVEKVGKMVDIPVREGFFGSGKKALAEAFVGLDVQTVAGKIDHLLDTLSKDFGAELVENRLEEIYARIERINSPELANKVIMPIIPSKRLEKYRIQFLSKEELEKRVLEKTAELQKFNAELEHKVLERTEELQKLLEEQHKHDVELTKVNEDLRTRDVELTKVNEELLRLDRAKDDFVTLVSHQLRSPLTNIRWFAERLKKSANCNSDAGDSSMVHEIYNGVKQMVDFVNAILDSSRIEAGVVMCKPVDVEIVAATKTVVTEQKINADKKNIHIEEMYGAESITMKADPALWTSILQNLLSNAIKYTPKDGTIYVGIIKEPTQIALTVRDTGAGIPKLQQQHIFSKLFRATNARTLDQEGLGLGLYITKSIVTHAGGDIYFESEENKGTIFHVIFPLSGMISSEGGGRIE